MPTQEQTKKQLTPLQNFNLKIKDTRTQEYLTSVLGEKKNQFVTTLVSLVANNESLQQCDPMSLMFTALKATSLDLPIDPSLGFCAPIPYKNNRNNKTEAQFQIMRNGWVELAQRTGRVTRIANEPVYEGQLVSKNKFTGEYVFDEDAKKSDEIIGYMAYIRLSNGFEKTVYWTKEECKAHGLHYSQSFRKGYGLWVDNFDAMALKTVLKNVITKYAPKSIAMQAAIKADQATFDSNGNASYIDAPDDVRLNLNAPEEQPQPEEKEAAVAEKKAAVKNTRGKTGDPVVDLP